MAKTIKSRRNKGKRTRKNVIGPLKKGDLTNCGYHLNKTRKMRKKSLKCAVKKYGPLSTFRKLNALTTLNKNRNPSMSKKTLKDREWVKTTYL